MLGLCLQLRLVLLHDQLLREQLLRLNRAGRCWQEVPSCWELLRAVLGLSLASQGIKPGSGGGAGQLCSISVFPVRGGGRQRQFSPHSLSNYLQKETQLRAKGQHQLVTVTGFD